MNQMVIGQTNIVINSENKITSHINGNDVYLIEGKGTTPDVKHFVFKSELEKLGQNAGIFRAKIKSGCLVDFYFK